MLKLLVSDVDGTLLLKGQRQLSQKTQKYLETLYENGTKICVATGRSYYSARSVFTCLPFVDDLYYICDDGALGMYRGKAFYHKPLEYAFVDRVLRENAWKNAKKMFFTDTFSYLADGDESFFEHLAKTGIDAYLPIDNKQKISGHIYKIGIAEQNVTVLPAPENVRLAYNDGYFIEYACKYASKGSALAELQTRLFASPYETACLGDGENDVTMFKKASYTYAADGGDEALKQIAKGYFSSPENALQQICDLLS